VLVLAPCNLTQAGNKTVAGPAPRGVQPSYPLRQPFDVSHARIAAAAAAAAEAVLQPLMESSSGFRSQAWYEQRVAASSVAEVARGEYWRAGVVYLHPSHVCCMMVVGMVLNVHMAARARNTQGVLCRPLACLAPFHHTIRILQLPAH
jgi:hypothetical protein